MGFSAHCLNLYIIIIIYIINKISFILFVVLAGLNKVISLQSVGLKVE